ncbi:MAG TPA: hypothetical protein VMS21_14990, partial [Methylomirabilota bacterium]|nr:hypothetical protein [Methylomirabilota bacterium]
YDPRSGRFLQRDPVWDEQNVGGWHTFTGNNPLSKRDPLGMDGTDFDEFELQARLTTLEQAMKRLKDSGGSAQAAELRRAKNRLRAYCMQFPDEPAIKNAQAKVKVAEEAIESAKARAAPAAAAAGTPDCPPSAVPKAAPTPESAPSSDRWNQFVETITRYVQQQKKRFEKEPGEELTEAEQGEMRRLDQLAEAAEMVRDYQTGKLACDDPKARSRMLIAMTQLTRFFGGEPEKTAPKFNKVEKEIKEALKSSKVTPSMFRDWFRTFEQERKTLLKSND